MLSCFIQLKDSNASLNLAQILSIEWDYVPQGISPNYTTTVMLCGGNGFYLTQEDAKLLWKAIQGYNLRIQQYLMMAGGGIGPVRNTEPVTSQ